LAAVPDQVVIVLADAVLATAMQARVSSVLSTAEGVIWMSGIGDADVRTWIRPRVSPWA
jgi:hypothetical protein